MKRYAIDINDIPKKRPSIEEYDQKLAKYELKVQLGLMMPYDETNNISEKKYSTHWI